MYRINPVKGDPWECNGDHILMLVRTGELDDPVHRKRDRDGEIVKVTVNEWLTCKVDPIIKTARGLN